MGGIINFEVVKKRSCEGFCLSPIVVKRISPQSVEIGFHRTCFSMPFLEQGLQGLAHGEDSIWRLYKLTNEENSVYARYEIELTTDLGDSRDDILTTIIDRMAAKAYLKEIRTWGNEVNISELVRPHHYKLGDGVNIDSRTKILLEKTGVKNLRELSHMTREDLCEIPGISTIDVAKIEKSLAARGIFLRTAKVPTAC